MSATHTIPKIDPEKLPGTDENNFVCYPRRGDSLSFYSKLYDRRLGFDKGRFEIKPEEAAAYMKKRLGIDPAREEDRGTDVTERVCKIGERIYPPPKGLRSPLHHFFSEFFDWNELPLFKNFLRIDVSEGELRIRCFGVTGCKEHAVTPPLEDEVRINLELR